jgi:hypothetical protein
MFAVSLVFVVFVLQILLALVQVLPLLSFVGGTPQPLHLRNEWNAGIDGYFLVPPSLQGKGWMATITCDKSVKQLEVLTDQYVIPVVQYTSNGIVIIAALKLM